MEEFNFPVVCTVHLAARKFIATWILADTSNSFAVSAADRLSFLQFHRLILNYLILSHTCRIYPILNRKSSRRRRRRGRLKKVQPVPSSMAAESKSSFLLLCVCVLVFVLLVVPLDSAPQAFRRDPGHPHWHHGAFHTGRDSVRNDVRRMLHSRAEVVLFLYFLPYHVVPSLIMWSFARVKCSGSN